MRTLINGFALSMVVILGFHVTLVSAQNETKASFSWLKQFEGKWSSVSKSADGATIVGKGTMESRVLGTRVMNEFKATTGGMKFTAIQTLSFDSKKKRFVGSWIDSLNPYEWSYDGTLNETGKQIILYADGPDWSNPDKIKKYRDMYEFKDENTIEAKSQIMNDKGGWETFMIADMNKIPDSTVSKHGSSKTVMPFLMYTGQAEEAIDLYKTVFEDLKVNTLKKYGPGETGKEGTVQLAEVSIEGQPVKIIDSPDVHDFTFSGSISFFVQCKSEKQLKARFEKLSEGGKVMMPIDNYGFSRMFTWVSDKYGVHWQLNLQ